MFSLRFLKAAIGAIAANSHFVRGNDHGGSGVLTVTNAASPPNPLLLNVYSASLFAVTVPVSTNGHKTYHLLDGMHKLILSTYHGDTGYEEYIVLQKNINHLCGCANVD